MLNKFLLIFIWTLLGQACTIHSQEPNKQEKKVIVESKNSIPPNSIPIKIENGRIILQVIFNDSVPARLILDNGTSNLSLDKTFVLKNNQLRMSAEPKFFVDMATPMGKITCNISHDRLKINLGATTINSSNFSYIYDMSSWFYKDNVSGLFPMSSLGRGHIIYIDPRNNYLSFKDSLSYGQFVKIPFTMNSSQAFCIQSTLNIKSKDTSFNIKGTFLIDFGYSRDEIVINQTKMVGIKYKAEEGFEISGKGQKPEIIQNIYADTARLLNFYNTYFKNLRVSIERPEKGSIYEPYAGVIGARIFENYIVAIDYKSKNIYLKGLQKEIEVKENILYTKWGISIIAVPKTNYTDTSKCKWFVSFLKKDKKADVVGIKLWDEVQTIDNLPIEQFSLSVGQNALKKAKKLTFKREDGVTKVLGE